MAETNTTTTRTPPLHSSQRNLFGQINVAIVSMSYFFFQQQELSTSSASYHSILAFIAPVLLNFMQIKYQKMEISPFQTHPKSMGVAIANLFLYCFVYDAELRSSSSQTYARHGMVVFGWLGLVSMASFLLADSLGPLLYSLCLLFSAGEFLCRGLKMQWNWLHNQIVMGRVPLMLPSRLRAQAFPYTRAIPQPHV
ncbi:hypothetical protein ACSBR2_040858 [Camellia fascicularis]